MTAPTEAIARLEAAAKLEWFAEVDPADLRTLLAELAEARKVIDPFAECVDTTVDFPCWAKDPASLPLKNFRRASEFIRRVGK